MVPAQALLGKLALDDVLGRDARVIGAGQPQGVVPLHPAAPDEGVDQRVIERMTNVQRTSDVRRRNHDRERGRGGCRVRRKVAGLDPALVAAAIRRRPSVISGRHVSRV